MSKTVFILGAGFSMDAGIPSQAQLISRILSSDDLGDEFFKESLGRFNKLLNDQFLLPHDRYAHMPLEDIFTPIDRSLTDNISFRTMTQDKMQEIKEDIFYLIGKTLDNSVDHTKTDYIQNFSSYLLEQSKARIKNHNVKDPVSVISTNWDILLDKLLRDKVTEYNSTVENKTEPTSLKGKGVIDYCCYISSYEPNDHLTKPGLEAIGAGGFNIKLLKLHGSLNWLQCARCSRVYVSFDQKIALLRHKKNLKCRHCSNNYGTDVKQLTANVIMPTFLKNFLKTQYKLIWDNAGIELAEASKLIFIGYSLPQADFEMRQLLSRMVRDDAEIEVVTSGCPKYTGLKERYEIFFGSRTIKWHINGARSYFNEYYS